MKKISLLLLLLYSTSTFPCSLAPTVEPFIIDEKLKTIIPITPSFSVSKLSRGVKALHSCSGLASLELKQNQTVSQKQGYIFEVISGTFNVFHYKQAITISERHKTYLKKNKGYEGELFNFPFFENTNKAIDIVLQITAVSKSGKKSKAQFLKIKHDGTKLINNTKKPNLPKRCENKGGLFSQQMNCG